MTLELTTYQAKRLQAVADSLDTLDPDQPRTMQAAQMVEQLRALGWIVVQPVTRR
ncbi:hypothetical protein GCM10027289_30140 [Tsukamurella serpentis]